MTDKLSELMNEIKRAAVGDGKYAGLPSHVYSLFGDALAKLDEVAALEQRVEELEALVEPATHFAAAGYAEPQTDWRQALLDALAALPEHLR